MDVLGSSGLILRNLSLVQNNLGTDVHALATGLRVNSVADDPSGYAIAQTIQSRVNGLQQSVQNVQTANNLLNVVDGALSNVELILQRIRSLVVESRSDINSLGDIQNIQTELDQLLLEINRISQNTTFNGLSLLSGNYDTGQGITSIPYGATQVSNLVLAPGGYTGVSTAVNSQQYGYGSGPGPLVVPGTGMGGSQGVPPVGSFTPALMIFQVLSYSNNAIDPDTGINVGPGVLVQFTAYSKDPSLGAAPTYVDTSAVPINSGTITSSYTTPGSYAVGGGAPGATLFDFTLANLTQADVGATIAFVSTNGTPQNPSGQALTVNDGGQEGSTIAIDIPSVSTNALNISDISVMPTAVVNYQN
ncbi:MAG: flagellin N-terminal helical domain-containing protein, partial [Vulcanimicrobiaceae bacterium]